MTGSETERLGSSFTWQELDTLLKQMSAEPVAVEPWTGAELESLLRELDSAPLPEFDDSVCPWCGRPYEERKGQTGQGARAEKDTRGHTQGRKRQGKAG